jgi:hypothetical protein
LFAYLATMNVPQLAENKYFNAFSQTRDRVTSDVSSFFRLIGSDYQESRLLAPRFGAAIVWRDLSSPPRSITSREPTCSRHAYHLAPDARSLDQGTPSSATLSGGRTPMSVRLLASTADRPRVVSIVSATFRAGLFSPY